MIGRRPETHDYDQRYHHYFELVHENDLITVMLSQLDETMSSISSIPLVKYNYRYASNKWTVREVILHICDVERTFGYRALCAAKGYRVELKRLDGNFDIQNDEFNQLLAAFNASTGHTHDGTAGEGGPVGSIRDADSLNKILVDSTNNHLEFYVEVSSAAVQQLRIQDGAIVPITDNDIDLGTSSLEFKDLFIDLNF